MLSLFITGGKSMDSCPHPIFPFPLQLPMLSAIWWSRIIFRVMSVVHYIWIKKIWIYFKVVTNSKEISAARHRRIYSMKLINLFTMESENQPSKKLRLRGLPECEHLYVMSWRLVWRTANPFYFATHVVCSMWDNSTSVQSGHSRQRISVHFSRFCIRSSFSAVYTVVESCIRHSQVAIYLAMLNASSTADGIVQRRQSTVGVRPVRKWRIISRPTTLCWPSLKFHNWRQKGHC